MEGKAIYLIKVLVQLPDGTFKRLPVAREYYNGTTFVPNVVENTTEYDAKCHAHYILLDDLQYEEAPNE